MPFLGANKTTDICTRCSGSGFLPEHQSVDRGICYACSGKGRVTAAKVERAERKREEEKKELLDAIKANLDHIRQQPQPRYFFENVEVTNSLDSITLAYVRLLSYGEDFANRVRARIAANLNPKDNDKLEKFIEDELKKRQRRR